MAAGGKSTIAVDENGVLRKSTCGTQPNRCDRPCTCGTQPNRLCQGDLRRTQQQNSGPLSLLGGGSEMKQQCWWESEQAQQIARGWTTEKQRRHDERQKQAGDRESDWKLLMQQLGQDGISFTRSNTAAAAAAAVQATNDDEGFRGGSKPETAEAVGSSWCTKAHTSNTKRKKGGGNELKKGKLQKRKQLEQLGHRDQQRKQWWQLQQRQRQQRPDQTMGATQELRIRSSRCSNCANATESGERMVSKAELQTQEQSKKGKGRRRRQARRLKAAGAKAARDQ